MQHRYFAASNSSEGFKSYFSEIFEGSDRLYIIKGGPGTGKSSFMKRCADVAERAGAEIEYYYCSSDPSSLDGVLINNRGKRIGILDGTAPHVFEPKYPGAADEIVNLGQFWNSELLHEQKNEILSLANKKSTAYKRAYDYLRSCGNLRAVTDSLLLQAVNCEKLSSAAERQVRSLGLSDGKARVLPALTRAVAMTGKHTLTSFEDNAEQICTVGHFYGVGELYLEALAKELIKKDASLRISYDPVIPKRIDGIFLEDLKLAFVISDREQAEESETTQVNSRRFVCNERLRDVRGELRYAARLSRDCLDGAIHALSEAKVFHFLLEDIYKHAMHFGALNEFTKHFTENFLA